MRYLLLFLFSCFTLFAQAPKVVVFDFSGVIAKVKKQTMLEFLSSTLDQPYASLKKEFADEALYAALDQPEAYWSRHAKKDLPADWPVQFEIKKQEMIRPVHGMKELVDSLREKGIKVALLSNVKKHRALFLKNRGAYDSFAPVLLSCELKARKPHTKIYRRLIRELGCMPHECLFIDNSRKNVERAAALGIDAIQFKTIEQLTDELRLRGLLPRALVNALDTTHGS